MRKSASTHTTIALVGNSLAVRIPRDLAKATGLHRGSPVTLKVASGNRVIIKPEQPPLTLAKLLADVTPQNTGGEVDWGDPRGREIW